MILEDKIFWIVIVILALILGIDTVAKFFMVAGILFVPINIYNWITKKEVQ